MSDHLPECEMNDTIPHVDDNCGTGVYCCCDRLRACEQRVLTEAGDKWVAKVGRDAEAIGFARGVQAARDAVACINPVGHSRDWLHGTALAVIGALKEKP